MKIKLSITVIYIFPALNHLYVLLSFMKTCSNLIIMLRKGNFSQPQIKKKVNFIS